MGKRIRVVLFVALFLVANPGVAAADPEAEGTVGGLTSAVLLALITDDDAFATADLSILLASSNAMGTPTQHYGGYLSSSPDSGTCGNFWAHDTFDRHFTVMTSGDGTMTVIQQFKNGSFRTDDGLSPGSCDTTDGSPPGTVDAENDGEMHGYFIIPLPPGTTQTSTDPHCDAATMTDALCTTTTFMNTHFDPCYPVACPVTTFFFNYTSADTTLVEHTWKNASADRGGNRGDIRTTNSP
jgi:hypothetical protein